MKIVEGRAARAGTDEVIVGKAIRGRFKGLDLGQTFELRKNRPATVVGIFEDGGSSFESEVWADVKTLGAAFGREGTVSPCACAWRPEQVRRLQGPHRGEPAARTGRASETDYYEKQTERTASSSGRWAS